MAVIGVACDAGNAGFWGVVGSAGGRVLGVVEFVDDGVGVDDGVLLAGLLEEKKFPFVAKAIPPTVNMITIKTTRTTIKDDELFFCGMAPR